MAYVKITKLTSVKHIGTLVKYIENPDKTEQSEYLSGYACEPFTAVFDFLETKQLAERVSRQTSKGASSNEAYHLIQSFAPNEVTPEQAHEIGKKLANEFLGERFEYVIATHTDKDHVHNHIIINSVSFYDYKKLYTKPYATIDQLRSISDRLCLENDLSVIALPQKLGYSYKEWSARRTGTSWKSQIRKRLNFILKRATSYEQFKQYCADLNLYFNDHGKQPQFRLQGQERNVRADTLDRKTGLYSVERIKVQCKQNLEQCKGEPQPLDIVAEWENLQRKDYSFDAVPVPVPSSMIDKIGEGGLLLHTEDGKNLFLSNQLLDYDEDTQQYIFHVQLHRRYALCPTVINPDLRMADQASDKTVMGELLLAQMARANGVPVRDYLTSVDNLPAVQLQRKIIAIERKATRARVHQLNEMLWTLKNEGIEQAQDFTVALDALNKKAVAIQERIATAQNKRAQYEQVAKWLNAVQTYQPLQEQRATSPQRRLKKFVLEHGDELNAYDHAKERLDGYGISVEVQLDKVQDMIDQQRQQLQDLANEQRALEERIMKLRLVEQEVTNRVESRSENSEIGMLTL